MEKMTKIERVAAAVSGERPDRVPYSFWTHLPGIDLDPVLLAEKTYEFYKEYDIDVIKTMNNGMYAVEDFGCTVDYSEIQKGGTAKITSTPVAAPDDWDKIDVCSIDKGSLRRELYSLELLLDRLSSSGEEVPVLFTVFSPLTIADKLSAKKMLQHIAEGHGDKVKAALEKIARTTGALAECAIELGASGVFFASQMSNYDVMTADMYREYGEPYDRQVLEHCSGGWMNTLHAHGGNIIFEVLKDYPVQVFNWHAWESLPSVAAVHALTGKCLMGGMNRMDITHGERNAVTEQIFQCCSLMGGRNIILTPGCVIRYPLDKAMLHFIRTTKDEVEASLCAEAHASAELSVSFGA